MKKKAVVLLSGGLDSTTSLYWARRKGYSLCAVAVDYGQRHVREIASARRLANMAGARLFEVRLKLPWLKTSSLVDRGKAIPNTPAAKIGCGGIPSTYVPARNTMLLSLAASIADSTGASAIVTGANILDYSGYPDCRPEFMKAFEHVAKLGTRAGAEGRQLQILSPLIRLDKEGIIRLARRLRVPLKHTWSCYRGGRKPCGACDSCKLRAIGFRKAGMEDPAHG